MTKKNEKRNSEDSPKIIEVELEETIGVADHPATFVVAFDAFRHNISLAENLLDSFPEMALVMTVSALEIYFKQELREFNPFTKYLVGKRKLRLQSYEEMKEIFKKGLGVELPQLDPQSWRVITEFVPKRHRIIHHAGLNESGERIEITSEDARNCIEAVNSIVEKAKERIDGIKECDGTS